MARGKKGQDSRRDRLISRLSNEGYSGNKTRTIIRRAGFTIGNDEFRSVVRKSGGRGDRKPVADDAVRALRSAGLNIRESGTALRSAKVPVSNREVRQIRREIPVRDYNAPIDLSGYPIRVNPAQARAYRYVGTITARTDRDLIVKFDVQFGSDTLLSLTDIHAQFWEIGLLIQHSSELQGSSITLLGVELESIIVRD